MTKTLEGLLRERLSDSRAMIGSLDINHDRVLLHFGAIGALARVTLVIAENEISIAEPRDLRVAWIEADLGKRSRTPLDPAVPLKAILIDGALRVGKDGPEVQLFADDGATQLGVTLPGADGGVGETGEFVSFPAGENIAATFDGEKLTAGEGGPEIVLPEAFYQYVAEALLTGEDDEADPGAADGATGAETGAEGETPAGTDQGAPEPAVAKNAGVWINFENVRLDDLKAIAADEGVELAPEDNTKREIAAKINAKRGAEAPAAK